MKKKKILAFDTEGNPPGNFEDRLRTLLGEHQYDYFQFDYKDKISSFIKLLRKIDKANYDLVIMEGTGSAGGLAILLGRFLKGVPYVFSSGDAVAPFLSRRLPRMSPLFWLYEKQLYRWCAGFIGWTPYLCGRAMTMGARRVVTAASWAAFGAVDSEDRERTRLRQELGIPLDAIVVGIIGSLRWNSRVNYCYGFEIVRALQKHSPKGVIGLVIGSGDGRDRLEKIAGDQLGKTILLPGAVARSQVPNYLAAMDIVSLPQSVDGVGSFRYTTKVSEYLACHKPFVTGQIPMAYDFGDEWLWRLSGDAPWTEEYIDALGGLLSAITQQEIDKKKRSISSSIIFDKEDQVKRVGQFIGDLLS